MWHFWCWTADRQSGMPCWGIDLINDITDTAHIFSMYFSDNEALLGERISRLKRSDNVIDTRRKTCYEL